MKTKPKYQGIIIIRATSKIEAENLLQELVKNTGDWTRVYGIWDLVEPGAVEQILKKNYAWVHDQGNLKEKMHSRSQLELEKV